MLKLLITKSVDENIPHNERFAAQCRKCCNCKNKNMLIKFFFNLTHSSKAWRCTAGKYGDCDKSVWSPREEIRDCHKHHYLHK
jgi:hypothetical protein